MPLGPAARVGDNVTHPLPPVLTGTAGSPDVLIGFKPAWRGIPAHSAAVLQASVEASNAAIDKLEKATIAAAGSPAAPGAVAAEQTAKANALSQLGAAIASMSGFSDVHICNVPSPTPPHGPGVVIDGSKSVQINFMPACRMGDTVLEALGGPNKIMLGEMTVIIGD